MLKGVVKLRIICLGDSLTYGYGVKRAKSYPIQLRNILYEEGIEANVINQGVNGLTTGDLSKNISRKMINLEQGDIVLILIGSNDLLNLRLSTSKYIQTYRELIGIIKERGCKLYIATLPPIESIVLYGDDPEHRRQKYNKQLRKTAYENNLEIVELATLDKSLLSDGVHFGARGYHQIAQAFYDEIFSL